MGSARVQVLPDQGDWKITVDGEDRDERFTTQTEAAEEGRRVARELGAEFQLHSSRGDIRDKDSCGNDPRRIEG